MVEVLIKRLDPDVPMPSYAHPGDAGADHWDQVLDGLQTVDRLSGIIKVPPVLRDRLCSDEGIDREAVATAAERLRRSLTVHEERIAALSSRLAISKVGAELTPHDEVALEAYSEWLDSGAQVFSAHVALLDQAISCLREGADVPLLELPQHVAVMQSLRQVRDREAGAVSALETLGVTVPADALAIVTEWNEFRRPDFARMRKLMRTPVVFDGRNLFTTEQMTQQGFTYYSIGRA